MIFEPTSLDGSYVITPSPRGDNRGWFMRSFCKQEFETIGHTKEWVQMNHSFTATKGTIRGMHFQIKPYGEIKLVRCIAGAVFDVIIDLREESPSYLQWFGAELSAGNKKSLYIPEGFAHGFQTLTEDAELLYLHSAYYTPGYESGVLYNDPKINIQWPLPLTEISERDKSHTLL
ncbi:dTDP-4-dehydrorhamnose 3,5-epimerase [Niabella sp. CJ426]|uniref:dTDP-4-dehydrorhamnose 3,5-epimerase n=1 Tax=Niabella sp. CJ426 TaxID=3393740 RepID=UPI003D050613